MSHIRRHLTFANIVRPIRALDGSVKTIAAGDYQRAVPFVDASDETGGLARSIDVLKQGAAAMDEQRWVKSNVSRLTGRLQGATSLTEFGQHLLSDLVPTLGGGVAAYYVLDNGDGEVLRRVAAYGMADAAETSSVIKVGEGLVGQCAQERRTLTLTKLPPGETVPVEGESSQAGGTATMKDFRAAQQVKVKVVDTSGFCACLDGGAQALVAQRVAAHTDPQRGGVQCSGSAPAT